jgi:hypothetical protein
MYQFKRYCGWLILPVLIGFLITGFFIQDSLFAQPVTGTVSGSVYSDSTSAPVAYAKIILIDTTGIGQSGESYNFEDYDGSWGFFITLTDRMGNYSIDVPVGDYYVMVHIGLFHTYREFYDNASTLADATVITVTENNTTSGIDFGVPDFRPPTSPELGTITGTVLYDSSGNPVTRAKITIIDTSRIYRFNGWDDSNEDEDHGGFFGIFTTSTDSLGNYSINVPAADYYVQVTVGRLFHRYREFYDDAATLDSATVVTVTANNVTSGIDFGVPDFRPPTPPELGTVTGRVVYDSSGNPATRAKITLLDTSRIYRFNGWDGSNEDEDHGGFFGIFTTSTDSLGNYSINVPAADYYVQVTVGKLFHRYREFYDDAATLNSATVVTVTANNVTSGIDFGIPDFTSPYYSRRGTVTGTVTFENSGDPVLNAKIALFDTSGRNCRNWRDGRFWEYDDHRHQLNFDGFFGLFITRTDSSGNYILNVPEGDYYAACLVIVHDSTLHQIYLKFYDDADSLADATVVNVLRGDTTSSINFTIPDSLSGYFINAPTAVQRENNTIIKRVELNANYPNPFNPTTQISFTLPQTMDVRLIIYNSLGQTVKELIRGRMEPGIHIATWDATNESGELVASGIYYYMLITDSGNLIGKMLFLK